MSQKRVKTRKQVRRSKKTRRVRRKRGGASPPGHGQQVFQIAENPNAVLIKQHISELLDDANLTDEQKNEIKELIKSRLYELGTEGDTVWNLQENNLQDLQQVHRESVFSILHEIQNYSEDLEELVVFAGELTSWINDGVF